MNAIEKRSALLKQIKEKPGTWVGFEEFGCFLKWDDGELCCNPMNVDNSMDDAGGVAVENFEPKAFAQMCIDNFELDPEQLHQAMSQAIE